MREHRREMESEIGSLLGDLLPGGTARRWTSEGYAQGMLLHLMEHLGFAQQFLPNLVSSSRPGQFLPIAGCSFRAVDGTRTFAAYDPDLGVAVVMAALMTLRTHAPARRTRSASELRPAVAAAVGS